MKNIIKTIVLVLGIFFIQDAYAQPANDNCAGAQTITPDGTCVAGTTVGANDSWVGTVGCQSSNNHPDVWYSFVATGTQVDIVVTNGTMTGNIEFILVESTAPPCNGLVLEGSSCGASPLTSLVSNTVTPGATYYYTISSSTSSQGTFTTCVTNTTPPPAPGQDCGAAEVLCSEYNWTVGNVAAGQGTIGGNGSEEDLSTLGCLLSDERRPQWYTFTVGVTGTVEFLIDPLTNTDDYDWAIYDITTSGCNLISGGATEIACNYSGCPGNTGILNPAINPCLITNFNCQNGPACNAGDIAQFDVTPPTLIAGNTYVFVIDNFSAGPNGFNMTWGATQTMQIGQTGNFTSSLDATCLILTTTMTEYTGANSTYLWNYGDGNTSTSSTPPPYVYATTGTYTVSLTVTDAVGCVNTFSQTINVGCVPLPIELLDFTARYNGGSVDLNWITASEINNDYFTIEKTKDGYTYEVVAIVNGSGNSNTVTDYNEEDENPFNGISYYRLKQTDYDGEYSLSKTVAVEVRSNFDGINVYPNPVTGIGYLSFIADRATDIEVVVYDVTGRNVLTKKYSISKGRNNLELDTKSLNSGMYFLSIGTNKDIEKVKFIKD